ncbi:hypothetical protein [Methanoregula formicica]|nr:hypothetical protein [Methanoregula formicica]
MTNPPNSCIYCGNENPTINSITRRAISYKLNLVVFSSSYEMDTSQNQPPRIICDVCGRDYYLIANSEKHDYFENLIRSMRFSDTVAEYMIINNLDKGNLLEGYIGISKPYSLLAPIKKKIYADNFHIVFRANNHTYFMVFKSDDEGKIAFNAGKVS